MGNSTSSRHRPARSNCRAKRGGGTGAGLATTGVSSVSSTGLAPVRVLANDGRGTSIFGRSTGRAAAVCSGASACGADTTGASTSGSGMSSSSGRDGAAKGNSVRGSQLTTCMAFK
ncbi:hypothetical protein D3C72_1651900 [compost metagenome]